MESHQEETPSPGWALFPKRFDVAPEEADEWLTLLKKCLSSKFVMEGSQIRPVDLGELGWWQEWTPRTKDTSLQLYIIRSPEGLLVSLTSGTLDATDEEIEAWQSCMEQAAAQVGKDHRKFDWVAAIGPMPNTFTSGDRRLEKPLQLGEFTIAPGLVRHIEFIPAQQPMLGQTSIFASWPSVVRGQSRGYNRDSALRSAVRDLVQLCSFLSLVWDQPWVTRTAPQIGTELSIPEMGYWIKPDQGFQFSEPGILEIPDWINGAWERLKDDLALRALLAFHEGKRLEFNHPSFAAVAFVAAIETIGSAEVAQPRCRQCGVSSGAKKQFDHGLKKVMSEEKFERLTRLYGSRSRTAHTGALHGTETTGGWVPYPGELTLNPSLEFVLQLVEITQAARDLIIYQLTGPQAKTTTQEGNSHTNQE